MPVNGVLGGAASARGLGLHFLVAIICFAAVAAPMLNLRKGLFLTPPLGLVNLLCAFMRQVGLRGWGKGAN